jgi:hypothetical protein
MPAVVVELDIVSVVVVVLVEPDIVSAVAVVHVDLNIVSVVVVVHVELDIVSVVIWASTSPIFVRLAFEASPPESSNPHATAVPSCLRATQAEPPHIASATLVRSTL